MASPSTNAAKSRSEAATDRARQRELYKFFRPPSNTVGTSRAGVQDSVLAAHAQLVAWRMDVQRGMISLIDRDIQYFVAESTKTLDLLDSTKHENPVDAIWAGCINVPKTGRLCEHTINAAPPSDGGPVYFEVLDLSLDDRFNTLPFISGVPHFRFYCGVPLRTKKGINIGSLFVLDDKVRPPTSKATLAFLTTMAANVMTHLETMVEREERNHALNMNMCLAAFVDPEHQIHRQIPVNDNPTEPEPRTERSTATPVTRKNRRPSVRRSSYGHRRNASSKSGACQASPGVETTSKGPRSFSQDGSEDDASPRVKDGDYLNTFARAADLLRESLALEDGGGVVFMDTAAAVRKEAGDILDLWEQSSDEEEERVDMFQRRSSLANVALRSGARDSTPLEWKSGQRRAPRNLAEVLGSSVSLKRNAPSNGTTEAHPEGFQPLIPADLSKLVGRHPRGKLYTFDVDGALAEGSSGGEETMYNDSGTEPDRKHKKTTPSEREVKILLRHFPGAHQIMFLPLFDVNSQRWSACFAYTTSEFRTFSHETEFLHLLAFCSCLMTEVGRLATLAADQQKSDFIGSISHELRSPLHGILASCEFLADTECTAFQKSLVDTADSCARTLLDTINMVLDYSKINSFEKNWRTAGKQKRQQITTQDASQPALNIYGHVDLAAITEEVVEGVATGQMFKDLANVEIADLGPSARGRTAERGTVGDRTTLFANGTLVAKQQRRADVEVILDIEPRSWTFVTQPGAFRRVVMNLFGNALKYTLKGLIKVKLEAHKTAPNESTTRKSDSQEGTPTFVTLTVIDSGKGISPEYLKTKLFTPFAQEDTLAPGTGLGLSLVRTIVDMLGGEISIRSALDQGTKVTVTLPMIQGSPLSSTPSSAGSTVDRMNKDDSVTVMQRKAVGHSVALFWQNHAEDSSAQHDSAHAVRKTLEGYVAGWFSLPVMTDWTPSSTADIIFVDEIDLSALLAVAPNVTATHGGPMVVAMCTNASRHASVTTYAGCGTIEFVSKPFGPYKLANALRLCLDRHEGQQGTPRPGSLPVIVEPSAEVKPTVDDLTNAVEQVTLVGANSTNRDISVLRQGTTLAKEESANAQMAMDSGHSTGTGSSIEEGDQFPFLSAQIRNDGTVSPNDDIPRPPLESRKTISPTSHEMQLHEHRHTVVPSPMSQSGVLTATDQHLPAVPPQTPQRPPRLLLVDDNKVNLRLLQTFMKKRRYTNVHSAEDGLQAVESFTALADKDTPLDIIFMDISMPILNGFEATRRIRQIEEERRKGLTPMQTATPALIIALTGLASGRDQSEAFTSGVDLYMTKPVSFKEVGRLLDNWQANGGAGSADNVPHGALTGDMASTPGDAPK
ncbi:hypothetical protein B0A49_00838 [Cryomyces minteri]|uniref:Histidine kinase n=2 Tax=Cryomyces minteri TaxID=331657 RepID=A0A4U0XVU7_9PEZI|nr:hypothetical protein B0A49_00838 [Cryomyces minteri]